MNATLSMTLFGPLQMTQQPDELPQSLPDELPEELWDGPPSLFEQFGIRQEPITVHWNEWPSNTEDLGEHRRAIHAAFLGWMPPVEIEITNDSDPWQYLIMVVTIFQGRAEGDMIGKYGDAVSVPGRFFPWGDEQDQMEQKINAWYGDEIDFDNESIEENTDSFSELSAELHEATGGYVERVREEVKSIESRLKIIAAEVTEEAEEEERRREIEES